MLILNRPRFNDRDKTKNKNYDITMKRYNVVLFTKLEILVVIYHIKILRNLMLI